MTLHFIDVRPVHGVVLAVLLPSETDGPSGDDGDASEAVQAAPRFCTLIEDEGARVLDCDAAFTQMFGYALEELHGNSVLDQIHPDDQGRAVEGWLSVLSTGRNQQTRLRRARKDGSWMWVDTTLHNYLNEPGRNHVVVEIIDISAEMQAQEALAEHEELLRRLTNAMPVGLLHVDIERGIRYSNACLLEILYGADVPDGLGDGAGTGAPPGEHGSVGVLLATLTDDSLDAFEAALSQALGEGVDRDVEVVLVHPGGEERRALMSVRPLLRHGTDVSGAIICALDVTDSARARHELERRATYDQLTECHNRTATLAELVRELARPDSPGTGVIYVDLDRFKAVNDTRGHAAGDELLGLVAGRLRYASRESDLVGRLGGDEFLIVLRDLESCDVAMAVAERLCGSFAGPFEVTGGRIELRASLGVACATGFEADADELIRRADAAMYESKQCGAGQPVLAQASPSGFAGADAA
jgi:diguanylate cyclase (GGDEF)-like protein/PAS domain S-box-containing protein